MLSDAFVLKSLYNILVLWYNISVKEMRDCSHIKPTKMTIREFRSVIGVEDLLLSR